MIIANTNIFMASDHRLEQKDSRTETLRIWVDSPQATSAAEKVTLSQQAQEASPTSPDDLVSDNPKLMLIKELIEAMTGRSIRLLTAQDLERATREDLDKPPQANDASSPEFDIFDKVLLSIDRSIGGLFLLVKG